MPTINFQTRRTARNLDRAAPVGRTPLVDLRVRSRGIQGLGNAVARFGGQFERDSAVLERDETARRRLSQQAGEDLREREEGILAQDGSIQLQNAKPKYGALQAQTLNTDDVSDEDALKDGFEEDYIAGKLEEFDQGAQVLSEESGFNRLAQESYDRTVAVAREANEIQLRESLRLRKREAQRGVVFENFRSAPDLGRVYDFPPGDTIDAKVDSLNSLLDETANADGVKNLLTGDELRRERANANSEFLDNLVTSGLNHPNPEVQEDVARQVLGTSETKSEIQFTDKQQQRAINSEVNRILKPLASGNFTRRLNEKVDEGKDPQAMKGDLIQTREEVSSDPEHFEKVFNPSQMASLESTIADRMKQLNAATKNQSIFRDSISGKRKSHGPMSPDDVQAESYGFEQLLRGPLASGASPQEKAGGLVDLISGFGFMGTRTQEYIGQLLSSNRDDQQVALFVIEGLDDLAKRQGMPGIRVAEVRTEPQTGGVNVSTSVVDTISAMEPALQTFTQNARIFRRAGYSMEESLRRSQEMRDADEEKTEPQIEKEINTLIKDEKYSPEQYLASPEGAEILSAGDLGGITANQLADQPGFTVAYEALRETALRNGEGGAAAALSATEKAIREWGGSRIGALDGQATFLPMEKVFKADADVLQRDIAGDLVRVNGVNHGDALNDLTPRPDIRADGSIVFYLQRKDGSYVDVRGTGEALAYQFTPQATVGLNSRVGPQVDSKGETMLDLDGIPIIEKSDLSPEVERTLNSMADDFEDDLRERGIESTVDMGKIRSKLREVVRNNQNKQQDIFDVRADPGGQSELSRAKFFAAQVIEEEQDARNMWDAGRLLGMDIGFVSDPIDFFAEVMSRYSMGVAGKPEFQNVSVREQAIPLLIEAAVEDTPLLDVIGGIGGFPFGFQVPRTRADAEKKQRESR